MGEFVDKKELLRQEEQIDKSNIINMNRVGLMAWKFHSFLSPHENQELHRINKICLLNARTNNISNVVDGLVIRNLFPELDYEFVDGKYRINRNTDSGRKDSIIYGFGALTGLQPKKIHIRINDNNRDFKVKPVGLYFNWFEPFIVVNRSDDVSIMFDVNGKFKLYGMTSEALGCNVCG